MKNVMNVTKLASLLLFCVLGFTHSAQAQRYLTERATTGYNISISDGIKNLHTFSNGLKVSLDKKGSIEKIIVIDDKGVVFSPTSTTEITPFRLSINIKTNRCTVKVVLDRSKPDRKLDVDINCDTTN
jgi:hypothetical protein